MNMRKKILYGVHTVEQWLRAFWLVALVVGAGFTVFRTEVLQSIESTPHPALVYAIFGVAGSAVLLCAHALWRYLREEAFLRRLQETEQKDRLSILQAQTWRSDLRPACVALLDHPGEAQVQQAVIENELYVCEERLLSHLTLPSYLSGALVGLGLVGTFIGLLGALADLGLLFSSLTDMGGNDADPVAMFTNMLNKLQEPMRGMGTAFVASLYGLLGSLVLGLVIYSVRKSGMRAIGQVHVLIRQVTADEARVLRTIVTETSAPFAVLEEHQIRIEQMLSQLPFEFSRHLSVMAGLVETSREGQAELKALREVLAPALKRVVAEQTGTMEKVAAIHEQMASSHIQILKRLEELSHRRAPTLNRLAIGVLVSGAVATLAAACACLLLVSRVWQAESMAVTQLPQALTLPVALAPASEAASQAAMHSNATPALSPVGAASNPTAGRKNCTRKPHRIRPKHPESQTQQDQPPT